MLTTSGRPRAALGLAGLLALCLGALAPAQAGAAGAPARGKPGRIGDWYELRSRHVTLRTDLYPVEGERMVAELELVRALLAQALSLDLADDDDDRIEVVAFADREELREITGAPEIAGIQHTEDSGRQWILINGRLSDDEQEIAVAHEMAHALSYRVIPRQPKWFAEGLAEYLSSVAQAGADGARAVGALPTEDEGKQLARGPARARDLFAWDVRAGQGLLYATAWLLVRTLALERPEDLRAFERLLTEGVPASQAWSRTFPEWSPTAPGGQEALDRLLAQRARDLGGAGPAVSARAEPKIQTRRMSAADVHTVRLRLPRSWRSIPLRTEIEEALKADPGHVAALALLAGDPTNPRRELAARAVKAHPEDPEAWQLQARWLPPAAAAEREAALRKAVGLAPDRPEMRVALAEEIVFRAPAEAEALAGQAAAKVPWSSDALSVRATALAGLGRCEEAAAELQRSLDILRAEPSGFDAQGDRTLQERTQRLCRVPGAFRAEALLKRARAEADDGEHERALALLDQALALDPESLSGWDEHGTQLLELGRLDEAASSFRRQLEVAPRHLFARHNLARTLRRLGRPEEAEAAFRAHLEVIPDAISPVVQLGELLIDRDRAAEAAALLERTAVRVRNNPWILMDLGWARIVAGQERWGLADLDRALALRDTPMMRNNAAYALATANARLDRALGWVQSALERQAGELRALAGVRPGGSEVAGAETIFCAWDTLGWIRFRQGRLDEAERYVAAALAVRPNAEAARHLGEILERAGAPERAAAAYALALAIEPDLAARRRLEALVPAEEIPARVEAARARALRDRVLRRVKASGAVDRRVLLVLGADGVVQDVLPASGEEVAGARAGRGARHAVPFLDSGVPRLLVHGRYRCAEGTCAWLLGDEPVPAGPLPQ